MSDNDTNPATAYGSSQPYPGAPPQSVPTYPVTNGTPAGQPNPPAYGAPAAQPYPAAPGYGAQQPYPGGAQPYPPAQPYAPAQPNTSVQPYSAAQPYAAGQPYASAQPYAAGQPYAAPLPTSGLAVASLITGIAGIVLSFAVFPLLASLAAIITGHMAMKQTRPGSAIGGRGMAVAGLVLGYIGVAILALIVVVSVFSFLFIGSIGFLPFLFS